MRVIALLPYCAPGESSFSPRGAGPRDGVAEHRGEAEAVQGEDPHRHDPGARDEQDGLDDLHPGGAAHAADQHVGDHHGADDGDDDGLPGLAGDVEQQGDEAACAGHLGEQVEERHGQGGRGGRGADRALAHLERQHVAHRVLAGVPQELGDQQQRHQPRDEEADGVEETVVAVDRDRAGDAEERRGREVVAGDRDAVLRAGEAAARGVEVGRPAGGALADADHDRERDDHEQPEDRQVEDRVAALDPGGDDHLTSPSVRRPVSMSPRSWAASGSSFRSAKRT